MIWIRVPGKPVAKSNRYRIVRKGRHASLAKDPNVAEYENRVKEYATAVFSRFGDSVRFLHPVRVELWIVWHRRESDGRRSDLDNLTKAVQDALTAAGAWDDDSQVSTIYMTMRYDAEEEEWLDIVLSPDPDQPMPKKRKQTARSPASQTRSSASPKCRQGTPLPSAASSS